jgi:hypothetical protein
MGPARDPISGALPNGLSVPAPLAQVGVGAIVGF